MKKKIINVCGTARSGSTMVDLMLGNDQRAFSLGEIYAWFRPFRTHHFNIVCSCKKKKCPWEEIKVYNENEFYKKCFEILDVDVLVDSSKNLPWVIDNIKYAQKNGITVSNILLFKDPIKLYYSFWKRGRTTSQILKNGYVAYYKRFFQIGVPYISLNYNNLVADPSSTLEKLCKVLEIPYFFGKENFWEKEHHHLFGSLGTRKQVEISKSVIRKTEDYPQDFKDIIPKIEVEIKNDPNIQKILSKLRSCELQYSESLDKCVPHKPIWYYIAKAKQKVRKRFPKEWKYDQ